MDIRLTAGGLSLPVEMGTQGKKIALRFRNYAPLREEIKSMRGAEWKDPHWVVTDCPRNRTQLAILQGANPFAQYDALPLLKPRRKNLRKHQVEIFSFEMTRPGSIVAAEMGTGKTLPTIEAIEAIGGPGWWIGPKKVLEGTAIEFKKWDAKVQPDFISYHMLRKRVERLRGKAPRWVVYDESSFLKGPGSDWTKAAQHLSDGIREDWPDVGRTIELSGMPDPNEPVDWWSQAEIACPGYLREASAERLRQRLIKVNAYGTNDATGQQYPAEWEWRQDEIALLGRRLAGLVMFVRAADVQDLPELQVRYVDLEPAPDVLRAARLIANTAASAMQALNLLRQLSDGFQYREDADADRVETPKDTALADFLEENEEVGRAMVYASYKESVDRAVEVAVKAGWNVLRCDGRGYLYVGNGKPTTEECLRNLDRTLDPKTIWPLALVGHPKSGGYGLNLTACRMGCAYSLDFNYGDHAQARKRGHREGMDLAKGFTMVYLCHLPTDRYVLANHDGKRDIQQVTLDEVRKVLR